MAPLVPPAPGWIVTRSRASSPLRRGLFCWTRTSPSRYGRLRVGRQGRRWQELRRAKLPSPASSARTSPEMMVFARMHLGFELVSAQKEIITKIEMILFIW